MTDKKESAQAKEIRSLKVCLKAMELSRDMWKEKFSTLKGRVSELSMDLKK
tara:strand:- start:76 stop:228 length:153 start_codon:yes stop_codon:yes gene_type:complete